VTLADFNGDGKPDLATETEDNTVSVLLNKGGGKFGAAANYAIGYNPFDLVAGDFNGDGKLDLAATNYGENTISVLLGNGNGTFQTQVKYAAGLIPVGLVAGDFTGSGILDLATNDYGIESMSVLLGNGNGTFQPPAGYPISPDSQWIATGHFNGDGKLDIVVTTSYESSALVMLGNGDGTFQSPVGYPVGDYPYGVVVGDFNHDGKADLAVANFDDSTVSILLGNGDGTFQPQIVYPTGGYPILVSASDFNGDGNLDLAVSNIICFNLPCAQGTVSLLFGNGDGTFQPHVDYGQFGIFTEGLASGDLNGDGGVDLAVANGGLSGNSGMIAVQLNLSVIAVFPNAVNFGTEKVGVKSSPQTISIANPSGTPITISKPKISGADASDFAETTTCPLTPKTLAPGAECSISVTFDPKATGARSAKLSVKDSVPGSPQSIGLGGTGQ